VDTIVLGLTTLLQPAPLFFLLGGVLLGLIIGSIPGLNENIAFAVFLPFSFALEPTAALALMVGIYCAAAVGGAIPAIIIKVPGTASAMLTAVDGNAMARHGKANVALGIAISSSVFGGLASAIVLLLFAPVLADAALRFGYVENFALCVLGIAAVVGMLDKNVTKGFLAAALGLLIATVGLSQESGFPRFTFGQSDLYEGIPFVPMLVGLFGISAALTLAEEIFHARRTQQKVTSLPQITGSLVPDRKLARRLLPTWLSAAAIGNVIGVLPGAGMLMAIYLAFNQAARRYQRKFAGRPGEASWGDGAPEGIAAPEASNNAVVASSMVPLLSLGIPGNSVSALFIGALMIHGMAPGPLLFMQHADIAWMIMAAFLVANLVMGPLAIFVIRHVSGAIYRLPKEILIPVITILCLSGAYAEGNSLFNIWVALSAGFVGYFFHKVHIPHAPLILGLVLGERLEESFANSMALSDGNWFVFVDPASHPISLGLILVSLVFVLMPVINRIRSRAVPNNNG
jgi:putative tricarboxylic transport membrane protein